MRSGDKLRKTTDDYRLALTDEQRKNIKRNAVSFLPAANVSGGRSSRCVTALTGVAMCDIDHIPAEKMAQAIATAKADQHTMLAYVTISGQGLRILYCYEWDVTQPLETQKRFYKKAFRCGNTYYARLLGVDYDRACQDVVRLSVCAHSPELHYNPQSTPFTIADISAAVGHTIRERSAKNRVELIFNRLCKPRLEEAAVEFMPGSHNNYVMRIGYMMNDFGLPLDDVVTWAVGRFSAEYPQTEAVIRNCYAAQPDEFGKSAALVKNFNMRKAKDSDSNNASVEEIEDFLSRVVETRRNLLKDRIEYRLKADGESGFSFLTDVVAKSLWVHMSHERRVRLTDIYNVLESDFSKPYNPLHEYLYSLPEWTEEQPDYLDELARTVTVRGDETEQRLFAIYLKKWLVGMVASWLRHDVVNHVVLVFIGEQGSYKSTWFNHLLPLCLSDYYCVKFDSTNLNKDDLLLLNQNALVNLEEIDVMTERTANFFKATITATTTNVRAAYARYAEQREHVASYCGTGNNEHFLGETVSRRWLPFYVEKIVSPLEHPFNHSGIFAQALHLFQSGFRYWFDTKEIEALNIHNREFQVPCLEEELISICFRKPGPEEIGQFFPTSAILSYIAGNIGSKLNVVKVGMAMKRLGFENIRGAHGSRGWNCIQMTPEEIVCLRKRLAMDQRVVLPDSSELNG
jgi:hypothetical protein